MREGFSGPSLFFVYFFSTFALKLSYYENKCE